MNRMLISDQVLIDSPTASQRHGEGRANDSDKGHALRWEQKTVLLTHIIQNITRRGPISLEEHQKDSSLCCNEAVPGWKSSDTICHTKSVGRFAVAAKYLLP